MKYKLYKNIKLRYLHIFANLILHCKFVFSFERKTESERERESERKKERERNHIFPQKQNNCPKKLLRSTTGTYRGVFLINN